jgi:putative SOS response-associated peptidase YedK
VALTLSASLFSPGRRLYEWKQIDPKTKQPFAFLLKSGEPFAFAGVWDAWKNPATEEWIHSSGITPRCPMNSRPRFMTGWP